MEYLGRGSRGLCDTKDSETSPLPPLLSLACLASRMLILGLRARSRIHTPKAASKWATFHFGECPCGTLG